jgi:hypothetical protein
MDSQKDRRSLSFNQEAIPQAFVEIYGSGRSAQNSSRTDSRTRHKQWTLTSFQDFIQTLRHIPCIRYCIFLFPSAKTVHKGNSFLDAEVNKKSLNPGPNADPLEAFAIFRNFLNN